MSWTTTTGFPTETKIKTDAWRLELERYGYDSIYRLTSETIASDPHSVNGAVNYTYDAVGNRKQITSTLTPVPAGLWNHDANDRAVEPRRQRPLHGRAIPTMRMGTLLAPAASPTSTTSRTTLFKKPE